MEITRKQTAHGGLRFLILTDEDPKTHVARAVIANIQSQTVRRVPNVPALLRSELWQTINQSDPTLDELVRLVPLLRRFRGIELCLGTGETAWVRWRQWSSDSAVTQSLLTETTRRLIIPDYEPDADHYLAVQAAALLGGEVLDSPRSTLSLGDAAY